MSEVLNLLEHIRTNCDPKWTHGIGGSSFFFTSCTVKLDDLKSLAQAHREAASFYSWLTTAELRETPVSVVVSYVSGLRIEVKCVTQDGGRTLYVYRHRTSLLDRVFCREVRYVRHFVRARLAERKAFQSVRFEVERPPNDGRCSDDNCPCGLPGRPIPRRSGYLFISPEVVDFRRDARSVHELKAKLEGLAKSHMARLGVDGAVELVHPGIYSALLVCDLAARRRQLDLTVAAQDARDWWETGWVPLRATPLVERLAL